MSIFKTAIRNMGMGAVHFFAVAEKRVLQAVDGGASLRARRRTARQGHGDMTAAAARKAGPVPKQAFSTHHPGTRAASGPKRQEQGKGHNQARGIGEGPPRIAQRFARAPTAAQRARHLSRPFVFVASIEHFPAESLATGEGVPFLRVHT